MTLDGQLTLDFEAEPQFELRDYQKEAVDAIKQAKENGVYRPLVALPTGSGKTVIFCVVAKETEGRKLVLVHRDELLQQAVDKFRYIWNLDPTEEENEVEIGVIKAERNDVLSDIIVASVQTLSRRDRLNQLGSEFGIVVTDEAHHAAADSYLRIYESLKIPRPDVLSLGVTATPFRTDNRVLGSAFDEVVYYKSLLEMIVAGYLCDLRAYLVRTNVSLDNVRAGNDFNEKDLAGVVNSINRNQLIVESYLKYGEGRYGLCFTVDVKHAVDLAEFFKKRGIKAEAIYGELDYEERKRILKRFHEKDIRILCNCQILTEGFDEPAIDIIILARPTMSPVLYTQMIGRGTRIFPGKKDCLIIDIADITSKHDLNHLPILLGKEIPEDGSKSILDVIEEERDEENIRADYQHGAIRRISKIEEVDLFGRINLEWREGKTKDSFYIDLGRTGKVGIYQREGKWYVAYRRYDGKFVKYRENCPSESWAIESAESLAKKRGMPPTEKQITFLNRYIREYPPNITRGEASDRIYDKIEWFKERYGPNPKYK